MYRRKLFERSPLHPLPIGPFLHSSTLTSPPSHVYHSKHLIPPFLSHTSAPSLLQTLSFDIHPQSLGGRVGYLPGKPQLTDPFHHYRPCCFSTSHLPPVTRHASPLTPFPATLTDTPSRKSFACVSYAKQGVGVVSAWLTPQSQNETLPFSSPIRKTDNRKPTTLSACSTESLPNFHLVKSPPQTIKLGIIPFGGFA